MKFNKNEFGWKEKVSVNTDELVTKNDIPHYNETLITEISGDDYSSFTNNSYFNMSALNIDETKLYIGKNKININDAEDYTFRFVYNKEADTLMDEVNSIYIYNHKSYDGKNFIEDENSAVITTMIATFGAGGGTEEEAFDRYFKLYEVDKVELDNNCLPNDISIPNSLTVGIRIGDIGEYSVAEGFENTASGNYSHAEGNCTIASGGYSHAEGNGTTADNMCSHAEGNNTTASGDTSHAEGDGTTADNMCSHAEGNNTTASGDTSHAEGDGTTADNMCSHAEGNNTTASGDTSHAEGDGTKASSRNQHVQGKYNIEDTENKYAHIVGNGTYNYNTEEEVRSNAHTLDWDGNAWYQGKLSQDGTPTEDKDLTTKKYVDDKVAGVNASTITGLATVATSGSYNDLTNKPIIPSIEGLATETYVNNKLSSMPKSLAGHNGAQVLSYIDKHNILERENMIDKAFQVFTSLSYSTSTPTSGDISNLSVNVVDFVNTIMNACTEFGEDIFLYFDFIFDSPIKFVVMPYSSNNMFAMIIDDRMTRVALQIEFTGDGTGEYTKTSTELVTKKYVDDTIASQPTFSFNDSGELVVTINGVSKTFVPKQ